jgi:hypothetical protein
VALIVSLKNLSRFHEVYGFVASDDLLRAVAIMIRDAVRDLGSNSDFLGHLSASDFPDPHQRSMFPRCVSGSAGGWSSRLTISTAIRIVKWARSAIIGCRFKSKRSA